MRPPSPIASGIHLVGKGIVDPVDDFRDTNPPSNPQLLDVLAKDFVKNGYRLKPLVRRILNSQTYQLASDGAPEPSATAADPDRYFTKAAIRMLAAEQILDAISSATGVPETFKGLSEPGTPGYRARRRRHQSSVPAGVFEAGA